MENEYIERPEFTEFSKRMEAEDNRQNHRIEILEKSVEQNGQLTMSVEKLATNMENMLKEQEKQGKRLDSLEARDGEMWRKTIGYIVTAIIGIMIGFIFTQLGF